jgi:hypothetical protein
MAMVSRGIRYVAAGCLGAALCVLVGVAGAADMGQTVSQACSRCHSTKRICMNQGVKSEAAWKATVAAMIDKGAQLPAGQAAAAAAYLAGLASGAGPLCR